MDIKEEVINLFEGLIAECSSRANYSPGNNDDLDDFIVQVEKTNPGDLQDLREYLLWAVDHAAQLPSSAPSPSELLGTAWQHLWWAQGEE